MSTALLALLGVVLFAALLYVLGRHTFWLPHRPAHWPRILMYHRVDHEPPSGMNCPPARFEQHLQWLKRGGYSFATMSELTQAAADKTAVLTFDDGYADNFEQLFPLLKRYQAKATIYLAPEIAGIRKLTPEQIRLMQASGLVEFGAHTLRHVNLTQQAPNDAEHEIRASKAAVEATTGRPCASFAYPFGRYRAEHVAMVKQAGYQSAVTVRKAIAPTEGPRYEIPRISMSGQASWLQFHIALRTGRYKL